MLTLVSIAAATTIIVAIVVARRLRRRQPCTHPQRRARGRAIDRAGSTGVALAGWRRSKV